MHKTKSINFTIGYESVRRERAIAVAAETLIEKELESEALVFANKIIALCNKEKPGSAVAVFALAHVIDRCMESLA